VSVYLSAERLKIAVERLGVCSAHSRLTDYLIFLRATVIAKKAEGAENTSPSVVTGLRSPRFVQAINEWAARTPELWAARVPDFNRLTQDANPYFTPIAAKRDSSKGYKSGSYPSNGPSDTVAGWQSQQATPFVLIQGTSPKEYLHAELTDSELRKMFTTSGAQRNFSGELPRLSDVAAWWFRFTDLEPRFGSELSFEKFTSGFKEDFGLTELVITTLFVDDASEETLWTDEVSAVSDFADVMAEPVEYLPPAAHRASRSARANQSSSARATPTEPLPVEDLHTYIRSRGFNFEPWQIATYVSAVRTKPFVILAGISGTGKTKLPRLVAEATGGICETVPVRPDWHDSSDLLGYVGLNGEFHPGHLLRFAKRATENPDQQFFFVMDEMNIARVEYYLAEVLSRLEERSRNESGSLQSEPFFSNLAGSAADEWASIGLPGNLCLVGSVNMDETTFGFSKKVLDRGFVIEFSTVDLSLVDQAEAPAEPLIPWGSNIWEQSSLSLPEHPLRDDGEVTRVIEALTVVNESLSNAQLQVGYRVRDEVAIFCLEAQRCPDQFLTTTAGTVDPLDIAIAMKVLPRIQGSGVVIRRLLESLLDWASATENRTEDPGTGLSNGFPFCEERLQLMQRRLQDTGFANYWV
jgi:hypothetical protein